MDTPPAVRPHHFLYGGGVRNCLNKRGSMYLFSTCIHHKKALCVLTRGKLMQMTELGAVTGIKFPRQSKQPAYHLQLLHTGQI